MAALLLFSTASAQLRSNIQSISLRAVKPPPGVIAAELRSPQVVEIRNNGIGEFRVLNGNSFPVAVILDVQAVGASSERKTTNPAPGPAEAVQLAASGFLLPAHSERAVQYRVSAVQTERWFVLRAVLFSHDPTALAGSSQNAVLTQLVHAVPHGGANKGRLPDEALWNELRKEEASILSELRARLPSDGFRYDVQSTAVSVR
jgi:hypothetical protein